KAQQTRAAEQAAEISKKWTRQRVNRYGTEERFTPVEARYVRLRAEGTDAPDTVHEQKYGFRLDEFEIWTADSKPRNVALASAGARAEGAAREAKGVKGAYGAELTIDGRFGQRWVATGPELLITLAKAERIDRVFFSSGRLHDLGEDHFLTS